MSYGACELLLGACRPSAPSLAPMYESPRAGSKLAPAAASHARALAPTGTRERHATYTLLPSGRLHARQVV